MILYDLVDGPYPDDEIEGAFAAQFRCDPEDDTGYQKRWIVFYSEKDALDLVEHFKTSIKPVDLRKNGEDDE